jgi:putative transcriptional regulator
MEKKLKDWRKTQKLTQKQAAKRLSIPLATLRNWEQGRYQPVGLARTTLLSIIEKDNHK